MIVFTEDFEPNFFFLVFFLSFSQQLVVNGLYLLKLVKRKHSYLFQLVVLYYFPSSDPTLGVATLHTRKKSPVRYWWPDLTQVNYNT